MLAINSDDDKKNAIKALNNTDKLFRLCRINLIRHGETDKIADIADEYSIVPLVNELQVVNELLKDAYTLDLNDRLVIDFTDMIVLPLSYRKQIPTYKVVFVDECQDLSTAQRELMLSFAKGGRFIAVGDRRQAINGFAGADCLSFDKIAKQPNTKELPLSVNYRCGKEIIKLAQEIVPEITAHDGAIDGIVDSVNKLELSTFKPNDMVLCRTSAPLVVMCLKLIRKGVTAVVKGRDIANGLISLIDKSKSKTIKGFISWADVEKEKLAKDIAKKENMSPEEAKETGRYIAYCDRIDCILAIGENVSSLSAVKQQIDEMFNDTRLPNAVTFSTAHKSKGLEADRVLILLPDKLPLTWKGQQPWEFEQEMNLKYVALTRAKKELVFVNLSQSALFQLEFEK
jgi:superfamily I DNA/RNA helicase